MERLRRLFLALLLLAIFTGGGLLLYRQLSPGQALEISFSSPSPGLVVQISGEVAQPGVYELPAGSRVGDLIAAAQGLTSQADERTLNLAQRLRDGDHVHVYRRGEVPQRVNLNTAPDWLLEALPKIGPKTAQKIIESRQMEGPFRSPRELVERKLVSESVFQAIRELITAP
ncbi:MAG: competence protein ComEA [Chloroflexi bacterium]|nr:MAG: competence protein ComEA [Chloroflexota bacterium]